MLPGESQSPPEYSYKQRIYEVLESKTLILPAGRFIAGSLTLLIFLNVIAAVIETDNGLFTSYAPSFDAFAMFSVGVFTIEYVLRVWVCTSNPRYSAPVTGRLRYMASPVAIIDLVVIIPFFLLPFLTGFPGVFKFIRFFRIFWIVKLTHYSRSLKTFGRVFIAKKGDIFTAFFVMIVLLIISSSLMFFAERAAQPTKFSSVLASMWWGVETLTTIGYGDMVPVTPLGKLIGGMVMMMGVGLFALPAGIFASGFFEERNRQRELHRDEKTVCPHCGKDIHDAPPKNQ
ncbi:MAG: ion transporter [Methanoregula sp.]